MNRISRIQSLLFLPVTIALLASPHICQKSDAARTDAKFQLEIEETDLIHYGDVIEIDVLGGVEFDWRGSIGPEGFLSSYDVPIDSVFALCRTPEELADEVTIELSKLLKSPQVKVRILDRSSRPLVLLTGAVRNPHRFQVKRPVTLRELLVLSGGMTDRSSGQVQIYRPSRVSCSALRAKESEASEEGAAPVSLRDFLDISLIDILRGEAESNPLIGFGDVITVLEATPIYVIGAVSNPGQLAARVDMTVSRAIAAAGGLAKDADLSRIRIFRKKAAGSAVIEVDLSKPKDGPESDPLLFAYDVLEIGERGRRGGDTTLYIGPAEGVGRSPQNLPLRVIE